MAVTFLERDRKILDLQQKTLQIQRQIDRLMADRDDQVRHAERMYHGKVIALLQETAQAWIPCSAVYDAVSTDPVPTFIGCEVSLPQPGAPSAYVRVRVGDRTADLNVGRHLESPDLRERLHALVKVCRSGESGDGGIQTSAFSPKPAIPQTEGDQGG